MSPEQTENRSFSGHLIGGIVRGEKRGIHALQEWAAFRTLAVYWNIGGLGERAKIYFNQMAKAVSAGQEMSLSEGANELLSKCCLGVSGVQNIPETGPLVVVANHWKRGPLHGMWQSFATSREVNLVRLGQETRWTIKDSFSFFNTGWELPASAYVIDLMAKAYNLITVTAPFKVERRRVKKIPRPVLDTLSQGGVIGLYPEAQASEGLVKGWEGSGYLVEFINRLRPETQVLPVGATSDGLNIFLNFGEAFPISEVVREGKPQEVSNELMKRVAPLVPQKYRGVYQTQPSLATP